MRTPATIARRLTCLTFGSALLAVTAIPAAAQLHPYHSTAYVEGNIFGFGAWEGDHFGYAVASGDFNGDGADDLATGIPGDDNLYGEFPGSGIVIVRYGVPGAGLKGGLANTVLTQAWPTSPDRPAYDQFGSSLTAGDFDGNGFDDLAVGIPWDRDSDGDGGGQGVPEGGVQIYYGSSTGLQLSSAQFFSQGHDGVPGAGDFDWEFGRAVAAGDFDGNGFADLAIGQPSYSSDLDSDCGRVVILRGGPAGLSGAGVQVFTQDHPDMDGSNESEDNAGSALAAGDFNGDGRDDLAVGVPGENDGGGVHVIFGSSTGLSATGNNLWTQSDSDVPENDEAGDELGAALAVGDFDGDGFDDIAAGAPGEGLGSAAGAGAVFVLSGSPAGAPGMTWTLWASSIAGLGSSEAGDDWGRGLAAGDFDHDGFDDLAIGAPGESLGTTAGTGEVTVLRGNAAGLTSYRGQLLNQGTIGVPDVNEAGDGFGFALAAGDFDGNGHADLVAGAPNESTLYYYDGAATGLYGFVFADDFESAGTARWQLTNRSLLRNTNGISASTAAKLGTSGQYGLSISLLDAASNAVYVMAGPNQGFNAHTTLRGSFFIDVQNLTMSPAPGVNFFRLMSFEDAVGTGAKPRLTFELNRNDSVGGWAILVNSWNDAANALQFAGGGGFALTGDPNGHNVRIDFEWRAGNPGHLSLWKTRYVGGYPDSAGTVPVLSVDLPGAGTAVINALYMGMISGKDPGTFGQLYLDELSISR